jgi:putative membrane protein
LNDTACTSEKEEEHEMNQQEKTPQSVRKQEIALKLPVNGRRVTDHLANERTFLAWIRTGLATITFGFVVERFGLVVRELDPRTRSLFVLSFHASTLIGVALTVLGVIILLFALINFLHNRRSIDMEQFRSSARFAIVLTILGSAIGGLLAVYLLLSA